MVSIKTLGLLYSVTWNPFLGECCNDPLIKAVYLFCLRKLRVNALFTVTCTLISTLLLYSICIHKILNFLSTGIFGQKSYPHQEQNCEVNIWPPLFDWFGFVWFFSFVLGGCLFLLLIFTLCLLHFWFSCFNCLVFSTHISVAEVVQVPSQLLCITLIFIQVNRNKICKLNLYGASSAHNTFP